MGKVVLIIALLMAVIVVAASVTLSVERKSDVIPEKIAAKEIRSDLINLGAYALKWAIRQVRSEHVTQSNTSIFDNMQGTYHYSYFDVPALDGSIDQISYTFGDAELGGGDGNTDVDFDIEEDGEVIVNDDVSLDVTVVGTAIDNGSYDLPVTMRLSVDGTTYEPFGYYTQPVSSNLNDGGNPRTWTCPDSVEAGSNIIIYGYSFSKSHSWYDGSQNSHWQSNYSRSSVGNDFVIVLRDGDPVPDVEGMRDQASVEEYLSEYISGGSIDIGVNDAIYLFELGTNSLNSSAADFQDLVVLVTFTMTGDGGQDDSSPVQEVEIIETPGLDMIFADGDITLTGSAGITGTTGTNSTDDNSVYFAWSTEVDGDFYVGPGADYEDVINSAGWGREPEDNITGSISNLPSERSYDLPAYPDFPELTDRGSFSTPWTSSGQYVIDQDGYYSSISATSNRTITINVGSATRYIVVGSLSVGQGNITLQGTGNLVLYVENSFSLTGSSVINTGGDESKVTMYYSGSNTLNFGGSTEFNGSIYLEDADITITGSGGITGHIICGGSTVNVTGNADANVRAVYAPEADINVTGSGRIRGLVIANELSLSGSGRIIYDNSWVAPIPGIEDVEEEEEIDEEEVQQYVIRVDIDALVSEDEYGNENDRESFASILVTYSTGDSEGDGGGFDEEEEEEIPSIVLAGDICLNPTNNGSKRFEMVTPDGTIDRTTINNNGPTYTYTGSASEIQFRPKSNGKTITVNGTDIVLRTNKTYTISADDMTVNLRNTRGYGNWGQSKNYWWIEINCTDPTMEPDPGLPEIEEFDVEEEIDIAEEDQSDEGYTVEEVEILYWQP